MSLQELWDRFSRLSPITVMVRAALVHAFSAESVDALFAAHAERQQPRELLFSSIVDLLTAVVWRQKNSVGEAYHQAHEQFSVSVRSVYNKLNGVETQVCRALVREPAARLGPVVRRLSRRKPLVPGYGVRIIDGNHLTSTDHRLKPLRRTRSGPLPGQALAVLDPDRMLIVDLFCCEDGEAQERRLFPEVIPSTGPREIWIADRNFCTTGFLFGLADRGASFLIRQHSSTLRWEQETKLKRVGEVENGILFTHTLQLQDEEGRELAVRRVVLKLQQPTTSGESEIQLLTNLPRRKVGDARVAELYHQRWRIENAFQEIEQALRSEINTLAYPGAALLGFAIAVNTYNVLSVVKWAIEAEHAEEITREALSGFYLASIVSADYGGMLIALPPPTWIRRYATLTASAFARQLRTLASHVRPETYRKHVRGPKRPRPKPSSGRINHHVSTAVMLAKQK